MMTLRFKGLRTQISGLKSDRSLSLETQNTRSIQNQKETVVHIGITHNMWLFVICDCKNTTSVIFTGFVQTLLGTAVVS